jgi:Ca-activated chloride channel family protein
VRRIGEIIDELDLHGQNQELIHELVELSTKHGVLTPYTSFLAEEGVRPELASSTNLLLTRENLAALEDAEGRSGVAQRAAKRFYQFSDRAESVLSGGAGGSPRYGGRVTKLKASGQNSAQPAPIGAAYFDAKTDEAVAVDTVRTNGNQALYKRGRLVVTPETAGLDVERDQAKIQIVERYSADYFALVSANSAVENQILSNQRDDEELLVNFRGQTYWIK